jgi:hypothetical protein
VARANTQPEASWGELGKHLDLLGHGHRVSGEGGHDGGPKENALGAEGGTGKQGEGIQTGASRDYPSRRNAHSFGLLYFRKNFGRGRTWYIGTPGQ